LEVTVVGDRRAAVRVRPEGGHDVPRRRRGPPKWDFEEYKRRFRAPARTAGIKA
jgi:hypothetical protein